MMEVGRAGYDREKYKLVEVVEKQGGEVSKRYGHVMQRATINK